MVIVTVQQVTPSNTQPNKLTQIHVMSWCIFGLVAQVTSCWRNLNSKKMHWYV